MSGPPPPAVLRAFGLRGPAARLPGGQGTSWWMGDVVLKPGVDPGYQEWLGTEVAAIGQRGFRMPEVPRARGGAWVVEGWGAQTVVAGAPAKGSAGEWGAVIAASRALHAATAALRPPALLHRRTDPWALADRMAWGETTVVVAPQLADLVERLRGAASPLGRPQLVHGDLTGNVLLRAGEPPVVLDLSPYWRPPAYAEGVVVADALCFHDARPGLVAELGVGPDAVARALLFRVLTASLLHRGHRAGLVEEARRHRAVMAALGL